MLGIDANQIKFILEVKLPVSNGARFTIEDQTISGDPDGPACRYYHFSENWTSKHSSCSDDHVQWGSVRSQLIPI